VSSQNSFELSWVSNVPLEKMTDPAVNGPALFVPPLAMESGSESAACFELKIPQSVVDRYPLVAAPAWATATVNPVPMIAPVPPEIVRIEEVTSVKLPNVKAFCLA
jgi:hypothetical protein